MLDDPDDRPLCRASGPGRCLRREVIAEGVETQAHGKRLLAMGCELAQGYGIARPMPASLFRPGWPTGRPRSQTGWRESTFQGGMRLPLVHQACASSVSTTQADHRAAHHRQALDGGRWPARCAQGGLRQGHQARCCQRRWPLENRQQGTPCAAEATGHFGQGRMVVAMHRHLQVRVGADPWSAGSTGGLPPPRGACPAAARRRGGVGVRLAGMCVGIQPGDVHGSATTAELAARARRRAKVGPQASPLHHDAVQRTIHIGQHVRGGISVGCTLQGSPVPALRRGCAGPRPAVDAVAQRLGAGRSAQVRGCPTCTASNRSGMPNATAASSVSVRGIHAVHVERRVGLGASQLLGLGQRRASNDSPCRAWR